MALEVVGKLYKKFPSESKSPTFQTREFVIEIADGNYPQLVKFQMTQDRCQLLDNYNEGEEIKVHFDLRGREWQGKFLTNLNCWRLEKSSGEAAAPTGNAVPVQQVQQSAPQKASAPPPASDFPSLADEPFKTVAEDDLPF
jgi:single-strand DNA-binding protein